MKKKKTLLVVIIVVVFLLVAGLLVWFLWPKKSNKEIFTDAIKSSLGFDQVTTLDDDELSEYQDYFKDKMIKLAIDGYAVMAGERSSDKLDLYYGKDQMYLSVEEKDTTGNTGLRAVLKDKKLYFTLVDILSKYYYVDVENFQMPTVSKEDSAVASKITDLLEESFFDTIENKKVETESTKISINKKEYSVKKYSYDYTGVDLYNAINNFVKGIKNDKEIYNELNKVIESFQERDMELDDILDAITSETAVLKDYTNKLFTYTVYLDGSDVISTVITVSISQEQISIPLSFTMNNVKNNGLLFKEMYLSTMGQRMFSAKYEETSEENANMSFAIMGEDIITGYVKRTDSKFKFRIEATDVFGSMLSGNYFFAMDEDMYDMDEVDVDFYFDIDLDKSKDGVNGKIKAEFSVDDEALILDYDVKTEEVSEMPSVDLSGSAPYEEMTEEDKKALEKFSNNYEAVDFNQQALFENAL